MKTTMLIVEYLIGGILVLSALTLLAASFFPNPIGNALSWVLAQHESLDTFSLAIAAILTAFAYGTGLVAEFIGLEIFEWWLDKIKKERLKDYLQRNNQNLHKSPILKQYKKHPSDKEASETIAPRLIGEMRFYVLKENQELYQDVESQLNRLRLIRVLFLVELILAVAIGWQLVRAYSPALLALLLLIIAMAVVNVTAIGLRFHRYCRAVERAYRVLVLDTE